MSLCNPDKPWPTLAEQICSTAAGLLRIRGIDVTPAIEGQIEAGMLRGKNAVQIANEIQQEVR